MNAETDTTPGAAAVTVTPAAYNALVAAARLRDIRLVKSDFLLTAEGAKRQDEWKLSQSCDIEYTHFDPEEELLFVWIAAEALCKIKNKKVVSFRCRYLVVYDVQGTPEEAAVDAYAKRVARFAAYPYFRAHVAGLASQAGLQLPVLPVIKETRLIPRDKAIASADSK